MSREAKGCSVDRCDKPHQGRGLCAMHLARLRRHGEAGDAIPQHAVSWEGATCHAEGCPSPVRAVGYCLPHYKRWRRHGDPAIKRPKAPPEERFWRKVDKKGPVPEFNPELGPCWIWTAGRTTQGYGGFHPDDTSMTTAHRWSFAEAHGPIPDGLVVDHLCRVHLCVNPAHLEAVTNLENLSRGLGYAIQNGMRDTCINGHKYTPENTYIQPSRGTRRCVACQRERDRDRGRSSRMKKENA